MSTLLRYAIDELNRAGYTTMTKDNEYDNEIAIAVIKLIKLFSEQEHSGFSASLVISLFQRLSKFQPLTPLTGEDDEWMEVTENTFQSKRCPTVFKEGNETYDLDSKVYVLPDGSKYGAKRPLINITFPYTPATEYIKVDDLP